MNDVPDDITACWTNACWALGVKAESEVLSELLGRWSEPHRRYHDLEHLESCLGLAEKHGASAERIGEVLFALFFHDAIYEPLRADNEAQSADLARKALGAMGADPQAIERIASMIEDTRTHQPRSADGALVLDVDLSILGASPARYAIFETQIRQEFASVPDAAFRAGRSAVLRRFLDRARLYTTPALHEALEAQARANLDHAIQSLG